MSYSHRSRVPPLACSGKYDPLAYHLNGLPGDEWRASFREIEAVPGFTLTRSARVYQAWWANERNPSQSQKLAWTKAGWEVSTVTPMAGQVAFRRVGCPNLASCPREPEPAASRSPGNATARASVKTPSGRESSRRTVHLVSCVKKKRPKCSRAKDLYVSDWFIKARRFVESTGCPWRILSAKYGLVSLEQVIAPYEKTLKAMPAPERLQWAKNVEAQIAKSLPDVERVVFLAGQPYREYLAARLERRGIDVEVPMEGLRMGEQLSWLGRHVDR